jgi:hypothetical protein
MVNIIDMKKIYLSIFIGLLFSSCDKTEVQEPVFDVSVDKSSYNLGDTVKFKFTGSVDYLTMYSGEPGFKYENKDRTTAPGQVLLNIKANLRNGTQQNTLSLLATNELGTARELDDVMSAPWTDITDRFTMPMATTGVSVDIGTADLTDLKKAGKPLYLAFRYRGVNSTTTVQPNWTITIFNLVNKVDDKTSLTVGALSAMGWKAIGVKNPTYGWTTSGGLFTSAPAKNSGDTENWAVSKALYVDAVNKDYGVSIKDMITAMPNQFEYIYLTKGTYKVTFVGKNSRNDQSTDVVREVEITIK